ncbi:hypothetical protein ACIA98_05815 [Streptomyces sp. NPDC051366]|uniref:hypothetical protein n=1 Tax=Streptomyces sp. NPDC051366 TaxID=3365652 RepID=UPI00378CD51D
MRVRRRVTRDALRRGLAGTALLTASAVLVGLIQAAPAGAVEVPPDTEPPYRPISLGQQARLDRCAGGFALHIGGPEMKKVASKALTGTPAGLATATDLATGMDPLRKAMLTDRDSREGSPVASAERREGWEASNKVYWETGNRGGVAQYAPQFDKDVVAFTLGPQRDLYYRLGEDGHAVASKTAADKASALAAELKGQDPNNDFVVKGMLEDATKTEYNYGAPTASDIARYLRLGGFMKEAPAEDSAEFRLEVEALKVAWGACDSRNPLDFYRVMSPIVVTAHMEWEAEYSSQATPRADIVNAEVAAAAEVRKSTEAMIEALGQAWLADQILTWQKYWAGQPATASNRPAAAVFTQADKDLATARTKAADQAKIAATASTAAKTAAGKADTAQNSAWAIADASKTPRGRGLLFAQQSVQVAKASAAAAEAAAKAAGTASNAAKATVADSKTLYALAQTQSHALNTEFRRIAAQEAAAQAKAAAEAAAVQAKEAADNATKAKAAQAKAETAQETARKAAETAKSERAKAEAEKATAAAERSKAATERAKAQAAEKRAEGERETAAQARTQAEGANSTASAKLTDALNAEHRAYLARDTAQQAERNKQATASRAAALEAAAAAAVGTAAAGETRAAATAARTAANEAAGAATRARADADTAGTAAVNARAAATRANGAKERAKAASDKAWAAYDTTLGASLTAHAAAADAIEASAKASGNAQKAEQEAAKAKAASQQASKDAAAARTEAVKTSAWSAVTAGHAFSASQAAAAARDSASEAIKPANTAIAVGTVYRESDSAAAFAVLVGQGSKALAEQQAAAATAKANEANKAATEAKALADKATGDAKLAAQAAAAAAADTSAALKSVAAARVSAAQAATAANAAKKADEKTTAYWGQAGADALYAGTAAKDAANEAAGANSEATEAEKSAANARAAANAATADAAAANTAATQSEKSATTAETAAANADQAAKDADSAATRAEEEARKRIEAERAQQVADPAAFAGPGMSLDDEALLLKECGQSCVDEWRKAMALTGKDVIDWVKENGADILLEFIGYTDLKNCLTKGDVEGCIWTFINVASLVLIVGKLPKVAQAVAKVVTGVTKFFEESAKTKKVLEQYRKLIERLKKDGPPKPPCASKKGVPASVKRASAPSLSSAAFDPEKCDLPEGVKMAPEFDELGVDNIRGSHVKGGSKVDDSKGLFHDDITDAQLEELFEKGMNDPAKFTLNKDNYYEKTFNQSGVGFASKNMGGHAATKITLVISAWGTIITMYPH